MKEYQRIKDLREDADKTQQEIADNLGMWLNTYRNYENGLREPPFSFMIELAKLYNISLDYLAGLIPTPRPLDDKPGKTITRLTPKQMLLLQKYQENPDLQKAIDRILMIQ